MYSVYIVTASCPKYGEYHYTIGSGYPDGKLCRLSVRHCIFIKLNSKKSRSGDRTRVDRTSLSKDLRLRPLGYNNTHNLIVLIVAIENARAL